MEASGIIHTLGMEAFLTGSTCAAACWCAHEDICRCSCGGKNHGVMRSSDGVQPARTRKLFGAVYQLVGVSTYDPNGCLAGMDRPIYDMASQIEHAAAAKVAHWYEIDRDPKPCYTRTATESQVAAWPELTSWRGVKYCRPLCLWQRQEDLG